jgi:four helix bundle protein
MNHTQFSYQRLEVYQVARRALALSIENRQCWRGLPGEVGPQFERAMLSVVNNIVEGAGRVSPADQRRHYQIARGSATEAAACLDIAGLYGAVPKALGDELTGYLFRVVQMLSKMARKA